MLKQFVEEQRERDRNGFYEHHRYSTSNVPDDRSLNRMKQILTNMPAYQKTRDELSNFHISEKSVENERLKVQEEADLYKLAKEDPDVRKEIFLRKPRSTMIHADDSGAMGKLREIPTERRLARPLPKTVPVDPDISRQEYNMKNLLAYRDENWKAAPDPLFKRQQDVFLAPTVDRTIQEMTTGPIRQKTVHTTDPLRPHEIPNLHSGYPVDFHPGSMSQKPKISIKSQFLKNPNYHEWLKPRIDLDEDIVPPTILGGRDGEPRHYDEGPGTAADIYEESSWTGQRTEYLQQMSPEYADGPSIPDVEYLNVPSVSNYPMTFQERNHAEPFKTDLQYADGTVSTRTREQFQQNPIHYTNGGQQPAQADVTTTKFRTILDVVQDHNREYADNRQPAQADVMTKKFKTISDLIQDRNREFKDSTRLEVGYHEKLARDNIRDGGFQLYERDLNDPARGDIDGSHKTPFTVQEIFGIERDQRPTVQHEKLNVQNDQVKDFKSILGLQNRSASFRDNTKNDINSDHHPVRSISNALNMLHFDPQYQDREKLTFERDVAPSPVMNDLDHVLRVRSTVPHAKVDINGRSFTKLDSRGLEQHQPIYEESLNNATIDVKQGSSTRNERGISDIPIPLASTTKIAVDTDTRYQPMMLDATDARPRETAMRENVDMNLPFVQGAKFTRVINEKHRSYANRPEIDYDYPLNVALGQNIKIRGRTQKKTRSSPLIPLVRPDIDIPSTHNTPVKIQRVNTSRPSTPRPMASRKIDIEVERMKEYLDLPNPF